MDERILLIDKPAGWTSFDVCAKIRSRIRAFYKAHGVTPTKRQLRVGHAGTLDPFATGLLIVLLGDGTKQAGDFLKKDKVYEATLRLGMTSTTGDPEGEITAVSSAIPSIEQVSATLAQFTGQVDQTPPAYSAIKVDGQRAYRLARAGKTVAMPLRQVTIHSLDVLDYTYPDIRVRAHVSSGTYIRSLAEDIGNALGTGAYCSVLRRTSIDIFSIDDAVTVEQYLENS